MFAHLTKTSLLLLVCFLAAPDAHAQQRIGRIIIIGNECTPDRVIRGRVHLFPGQLLERKDLQAAESRLRACVWLVNEPEREVSPTITILESDSEFKDLLIQVQDAKLACLYWPAHDAAVYAVVQGTPILFAGYWGPSRLHLAARVVRHLARIPLPCFLSAAEEARPLLTTAPR